MNVLPDKPSELIRLALADLKKVEADPRYIVDMARWHDPSEGKCAVCFAGAVMAQTLDAPIEAWFGELEFDDAVNEKIDALNEFRTGAVESGLRYMNSDLPSGMEPFQAFPQYHHSRAGFHAAMEQLAKDFEAHQL